MSNGKSLRSQTVSKVIPLQDEEWQLLIDFDHLTCLIDEEMMNDQIES